MATPTADAEPDTSATSADPATRSGPAGEAAAVLTLLEFPVGSLGGQLAADAYAQWERTPAPAWRPGSDPSTDSSKGSR